MSPSEPGAIWRRAPVIRLWMSTAPASFSWAMSQLVVGWLVFETTGAPAVVGLAYMARLAPLAITGLPIGAASDRVGRVRVLQLSNGLGVLGALLLALGQSPPTASVLLAVIASVLFGLSDSARLVATPHYAHDVVGRREATQAIALTMFVAGAGQVAGALLGGAVLAAAGPSVAAVVVAGGYLLAEAPLIGLRDSGHRSTKSLRWVDPIRQGLALARTNELVRELFLIALVTEVLAFAGIALDPVFAASVFGTGATGLGVIVGARAAGRLTGSLLIGVAHARHPFGRLLPGSVLLFGAALVGFALSPVLGVGVVFVFVAGLAGVLVDSLEQAALAAAAPAGERGRAEGLWVVALGLGPIGIAEISLLAQVSGPRVAQALNGSVVALFGLALVTGIYGRHLSSLDRSAIEVPAIPPLS